MRRNSLLFLLATTFFTTGVTLINEGTEDEWASMIKEDDSNDEEWKGLIRNWTEENPNRTESVNSQVDDNTIQLGAEYNYLFQSNEYNYLFKTNYYAGGLYRGILLKKYYLFNPEDN